MRNRESVVRRDVLGWSLYDFANTIYSMNIVSLYLKRYIVQDLGFDDRYFDIPFSVSMLCAAVLLPALGALSDHSTKKKIFVFLFTLTCCMAVGLMAYVPPALIWITIVLFVVANFSYEAGQPFYNALLYSVAEGKQARFVSGIGVSFGYVGSIVGMILVLPFVTGELFSLNIPFIHAEGKVGAFLPTAVLFMLFAVPLFAWVRESKIHIPRKINFLNSYREVWQAIRQTRKYPGVLRFLIADYFFEDTVTTVILNIGLYSSIVIGLDDSQITLFLIISTVSAVFGSLVLGKIAEYRSLKHLLAWIMIGWVIALALFVANSNMVVIWILGSVVGVLLGGLWTTSRPMLAEMVPREELGKFFGLFALSGRAAAVIGPLVWTTVVYLFRPERALGRYMTELFNLEVVSATRLPYKMGVVSLIIMLLIGLIIFRKVPHSRQVTHG
jgi:UMF1 family MFS transporter